MAQLQPQSEPDRPPGVPLRGVRMAQATGMVSAQADCSMATAIVLIHKRAELIGCSFGDIMLAVINRRIRFDR